MTTAVTDMTLKALPTRIRIIIKGSLYSQLLLYLLALFSALGWFKVFSSLDLCMLSSLIIIFSVYQLGIDSVGDPVYDRWRIRLYGFSLMFHCMEVLFIAHEEIRKFVG